MNKKRFAVIIILILFCCFSPYLFPLMINVFLALFRNTAGKFDLSIFWSAFSGGATFFLGIVALWQTSIFRKSDLIASNKILLYKIPEIHKEKYNRIKYSFSFDAGFIPDNNFLIFDSKDSKVSLSLNVNFVSSNGIIPNRYKVNEIMVSRVDEYKNILSNKLNYQNKSAIIVDLNENGFRCSIEIADERIRELHNEELYISFEILLFKKVNNGFIETRYAYGFNLSFNPNENGEIIGSANFKDLFLVENGARFVKKID